MKIIREICKTVFFLVLCYYALYFISRIPFIEYMADNYSKFYRPATLDAIFHKNQKDAPKFDPKIDLPAIPKTGPVFNSKT